MTTILTFLKQLDKLVHLLGCFGLTMTLGYLLTPSQGLPLAVAVSAFIVTLIGALKEAYDKQHPLTHTADIMDFLADVIGVSGACLVLLAPLILALLKAQA